MTAAPAPVRPRRLPWGLLALAGLFAAIGAVCLFAPDLPRSLAGRAGNAPPPLGEPPVSFASLAGGDLPERDIAILPLGVGDVRTADDAVRIIPVQPAAPAAAPAGTPDEGRAGVLLAEAESAYTAMDWDRAASGASRIAPLRCSPELSTRAAGVARGAVALKQLFGALDARDALCRNWDTHPSLLRLSKDGRDDLVVPMASLDGPPVLDDPLGWFERQRAAGGEVCFLQKAGRDFIATCQKLTGGVLTRVDQQALAVQLSRQLDRSVARIGSDPELRNDPKAWYEAGKFAYRNRLDARVTALLDRAFRLDGELCRTIREGNAAALFGAMVAHLKQGNKVQAQNYLTSIDKRYRDTRTAELAHLYAAGRTAELVATVRAAAPPPPRPDPTAAPLPEDTLARARQLSDMGRRPYLKASGMEATDERNALYKDAWSLLRQAKATYAAWCTANPGDADAATELIEVNNMEAAVRKYITL